MRVFNCAVVYFCVVFFQGPDQMMSDLARDYKLDVFDCDSDSDPVTGSDPDADELGYCRSIRDGDRIPDGEIEARYMQDPHVSFVIKAVSALTAAFRLVQLDNCGGPRSEFI